MIMQDPLSCNVIGYVNGLLLFLYGVLSLVYFLLSLNVRIF